MTDVLDELGRILDEAWWNSTWWEIAAALLVLIVSWPAAILIGRIVKMLLLRFPGVSDGRAMAGKRAVQLLVGLVGLAWSMSILDAGPGFILVVVGGVVVAVFALAQPLVRNTFAGPALPFLAGDEIETHDYAGTVTDITYRHTVIRTLDRRTVYIPNSDVLAAPIVVYTKLPRRRSSLDVWISYQNDIGAVSQLLIDTVSAIEGVHSDPAPYVIPRGFEDGRCQLTLKWRHDPDLKTEEILTGSVVTAVKSALDSAAVAIPPPVGVFLSEVPQGESNT